VENYPDLKAEQNFLRLQKRITALECEIADRREFFNDSVAVFNTRIRQVPYTAIANLPGYVPLEMYQVPESEKERVDVKSGT
jgi:LemA protein